MAKPKRKTVGSIYKSKTAGDAPYIKLRGDTAQDLARALANADAKKGLSLRLESKKSQLESVNKAHSEGKLNDEVADKIRDRIESIPDYVQFEIVLVESNG